MQAASDGVRRADLALHGSMVSALDALPTIPPPGGPAPTSTPVAYPSGAHLWRAPRSGARNQQPRTQPGCGRTDGCKGWGQDGVPWGCARRGTPRQHGRPPPAPPWRPQCGAPVSAPRSVCTLVTPVPHLPASITPFSNLRAGYADWNTWFYTSWAALLQLQVIRATFPHGATLRA